MPNNPEGHNPRYWRKHPQSENSNETSVAIPPEKRNAFEYLRLNWGEFCRKWLPRARNAKGKKRKAKEWIGLVLNLVLFALPLMVSMPVILRWGIWLVCYEASVYMSLHGFGLESLDVYDRLPVRSRIAIVVLSLIVFAISFRGLVRAQWREEKAGVSEGDLYLASAQATKRLVDIGGALLDDETPDEICYRFFRMPGSLLRTIMATCLFQL